MDRIQAAVAQPVDLARHGRAGTLVDDDDAGRPGRPLAQGVQAGGQHRSANGGDDHRQVRVDRMPGAGHQRPRLAR